MIDQCFIAVIMDRNHIVRKVGKKLFKSFPEHNLILKLLRCRPTSFPLIIHDGDDGRIGETLPPRAARILPLHLLLVPFPDIDHIAKYLHMDIIFYIRFMFNKRYKKKRCNVVFSTNFYFLDSVCLPLIGKQWHKLFGYILDILRSYIPEVRQVHVVIQELTAQVVVLKNDLACVVLWRGTKNAAFLTSFPLHFLV